MESGGAPADKQQDAAASGGGTAATAAPAKKSAYENLDKSELIAKCKGLLQLARSAKQTKDEYAAENARLKESLEAIQQQRTDDKQALSTLQSSLHKLNETVATLEEQKLLDKTYMKGMHEMVDELTNEKDTLARRVSRLTQDNDSLLRDCRQSDAILRQLNDSMAEHQQQVQQLQLMCAQQKEQNTELRAKHSHEVGVAQRAEEHRRTLHDRCQSHEAKLRLYRTKLVDFAGQLKQMRVCKEVLQSTVREYSQAVCQWQGDILNASNEFFTRNRELAAQNAQLQQRIVGLEERLAEGNSPASPVDLEQQHRYSEAMQQLDSTLATIATESAQLVQRHQTERALLAGECDALRSSLASETEQRDETIAALRLQLAKLAEQLRLAGDTSQLVLERNSLIEKGQHLVEMVGELQQNLTELRAQLQQQTEKGAEDQLVMDGLRVELNVAVERSRELESNQGQLDNSVQAVLEQAAQIESLQSELAVRSSDVEQLQKDLAAKQQSLLELEKLRSELTDRIGQFEQQLAHTAEENVSLQDQLTNLKDVSQSQADTLQIELVKCKSELEQLQATSSEHIATLQQNIEQLKQTSEQAQDDLRNQLAGDNQSTAELVASLRSELEFGRNDKQLLVDELNTLRADLQLVQQKFSDRQNDLDKLKETSERERSAMEEQLVSSKKLLENYESTLKLVEAQRSELTDRKSEFEQLAATSSHDQETLQDEIKQLKVALEKREATAELVELLQQKLNDRQQELETLKESSRKNADQLKQSKSASEQVESLLAQLEKCQNDYDKLQRDHSSTLKLQEELKEELINHQSTLQLAQSLRTELEDSKQAFDQLQGTSSREQQALQQQLTTVQDSLKHGEEASQVVETLRSELVERQRDIERLQETNRQQLENLSQSAELVDLGQQHLATERLTSQTLREEIAALRANELQQLSSDLQSTQQKLNEIESLRAELLDCNHALRDQVAVLQAELTQREEALSSAASVQSDRAELLAQVDASRQETAAVNELLEAVRCDLDERESSLACKSREMDEMLSEMRELNDALRNRGDVISKQEQQIEALTADAQQSKSIADELSAARLIIAELKTTATSEQKQRTAAEAEVQQLEALRSELTASQAQRSEMEAELSQLRTKHAASGEELQKLAAELKRTKASLKKTNVLSLEIEAQEKSLIDISQKLDAKTAALDELQQQNHQQDETIDGLKQQIRSMEDTLRAENEHSAELKTQIDAQQAQLKLAESRAADVQRDLDDAHRKSAAIDEELCDLRSANAQTADDLQQTNVALRSEQQQLLLRLRSADEAAAEWRTKHIAATEELDGLRTEFVAYKVRAQSQLRATQQLESSRECELEEELAAARATTSALATKLAAAQQLAKQLDATVAEQRGEAGRQREQVQQLLRVAEEARQNADAGQADLRQAQREHQEALRAQRLQTETLAASFKQEVLALQTQLEEQKRLQVQQQQFQQTQQKIESTTSTTSTTQHTSKQARPSDDQQRLDWILSASDRPAVEGSESNQSLQHQQQAAGTAHHHHQLPQQRRRLSTANSSSGRSHRELMPLDELLNASFESTTEGAGGAFDDDEYEAGLSSAFDAPAARQRLQVQETRVKHLSTLLAESEQDTARLTQLNDALKEELRRQERSAEREQHLHNLEYLKNVLFKFLTIQQGNEKAHLVTVLNTMLKLSPEETQKLQAVASGTDASQRGGWGRYLPL